MTIPYIIFLWAYVLAVIFILVFAAIIVLHVVRLSRLSSQVFLVAVVFLAGLMFILFSSYHSLVKIDWQSSINFGDTIQESFKEFNPL